MKKEFLQILAISLTLLSGIATAESKYVTSLGGATGLVTQTGSLRMRKLTATVNPAPADIGYVGNVWVVALLPNVGCGGVTGLYLLNDKGEWTPYMQYSEVAHKPYITMSNSIDVTLIDMTSVGVKPGPYLLRDCRVIQFYVVVGRYWRDALKYGTYFLAGTNAWTTGITTVGSDDWEIEQERLLGLMKKQGVSFISGQGVTITYPGDGKPDSTGSMVYYGLDDDDYLMFSSKKDLSTGTKFASCTEALAPGAPLNCTLPIAGTSSAPKGIGHQP